MLLGCFLWVSLLLCLATAQGQQPHAPAMPAMEQPTAVQLGLHGCVDSVTAVQQYEGGNDMTVQETWCFDAAGRLMKHVKRGFGGEHVTVYPRAVAANGLQKDYHDADGDLLERRCYTREGTLLSSAHYIYAEGGALAAVMTYEYSTDDENVVSGHSETYYDAGGRIVLIEQYTADAVLLMQEERKYNKHGDMVQREQHFIDGAEEDVTKEQRKYKYDKQGNWLCCQYFHNGKKLYTTTRTIAYYPAE